MTDFLNYNEVVTFVTTRVGNYGDNQIVDDMFEVDAIVEQGTAFDHSNNQDAIQSDMVIYVDPENDFVVSNYYRLEEMLVIVELFGVPESRAWFKVIDATVARDHLLENQIDNVRLELKKTSEIYNVS